MIISENIEKVREEYFELYKLLKEKSILNDDIISMGNLALFVDYSHNRYQWLEKKKTIYSFATQNNKNEVNMIVAQNLYEIAIRLDISDNLNFKLDKMKLMHKQKKLTYFDIVLDTYDFPEWFKRITMYFPKPTKKELYNAFRRELECFPGLLKGENQIALAYFVDVLYDRNDYIFHISKLDSIIQNNDENEIAWYLAKVIYSIYNSEMVNLNQIEEQKFIKNKMDEYTKLYKIKELRTFNFFSEKGKIKYLTTSK